MVDYDFLTTWRLAAPLNLVWETIYHSERWTEWWPGLLSVVELEKGDDSGIGNLRRYSWKGMLPYRLVFDIRITQIDQPFLLVGTASGDLSGTGVWRFSEDGGVVVVQYEWRVATHKEWMNLLAPIARPLFRWNHDQVMRWGEEGLARHLEQQRRGFGPAQN